jgi:Protein of Unknown function (DUF2784)
MPMKLYALLADLVVVVHAAYVAFVVLGLVAVLIGYLRRWNWVRNTWFRWTHTGMITIVTFESLLGITCPLTTLENHYRERAGQEVMQGSFVGQFVHAWLFYQAPAWQFTSAYCMFFTMVVVSLYLVPPTSRSTVA